MEKEPVEYTLHDTVFLVDIDQMELKEKGNKQNIISFQYMEDKRTHYECDYDPVQKKVLPYWTKHRPSAEAIRLQVPQLKDLDPEGTCRKYKKTSKQLEGKCDYELKVGASPLEYRLKDGLLPVIDIAGQAYVTDVRLGVLRPRDHLQNSGIDISSVESLAEVHSFYYHLPTRSQIKTYEVTATKSRDVVMVIIPGPARLDPIGMARRNGCQDNFYTSSFPVVLYRKAIVVPFEHTELALRMKNEAERRAQERKHLQTMTRTIPDQQNRKKGKKIS